MKKILNSKIFIISIFLMLVFIYNIYVDVGETKRHNATLSYLTVKKGYEESEIQINVKHSVLNIILSYEEWVISVVFNDEPNVIYYYHY